MTSTDDGFKDHFSSLAARYSEFRPGYPQELFEYLCSVTPETGLAWDCATGSGQAAVALASCFDAVIATDASQKQIEKVQPHPSVEYAVAPAENSGLEDASVDLITVAQALHWFDLPRFMQEVQRVLKPNGVLAAWTYNLFRISPPVDAVVDDLYWNTLHGFWDEARRMVERGYADLELPLDELQPPRFNMSAHWTLEHLQGYLGTWSAIRSYRDTMDACPVAEISPRLAQGWGEVGSKRKISWPLSLRVGVKRP